MRLWVLAGTRARYAVAGIVGVVVLLLWHFLTPPTLRTPSRVASLPRHDSGFYFDLAARARSAARDDPRLGLTVAAAYGDRVQSGPALGVLAAVIKLGHGDEIVASIANAVSSAGVTLGPRTAAAVGRHGGALECGPASFGTQSGTYCVWWNTHVVGIALMPDLEGASARSLALAARNATHR